MSTVSIQGPGSQIVSPLLAAAYDLQAYAVERAATADAAIGNLLSVVGDITAPSITADFPTAGAAPSVTLPGVPDFVEPVWTSPGIPAAFTEVLDVSDLQLEPFDEAAPTLTFGTAPAVFADAAPDAPAINLSFADPSLTVTMPAVPDLLSININPFDGLNLPVFDDDAPSFDIAAPSVIPYEPGAGYTSALLTAVQTSLEQRITQGGTGLSADAETAIWDRGREREAKTYTDQLLELERMERLGMAMPPGVYLAARVKLMTERDAQDRGHSREVMIKAAELELDNVKHALTTATQLEAQLINYTNSVEQRLFDATKYATEAGVQIYNAKVQAFAGLVDLYRAKATVYQSRVQAEAQKVDAYRAQVQAEEAKAQVNSALVAQYRIQIDAALSAIEIYKAQIAGIQAKADIERTKVMVFGEQVKAYATRINAYTASVEGYRASLQAEQTKQQVYQSSVEAFTARVQAATSQINARIDAYKGRIAAKTAEWDGYRATVQGESARIDGLVSQNKVIAEAYQAEVTGISAFNDTLTKQWQAILDQNQRISEIGVSAAKANAELYVSTRSVAADAAKVSAQIAGQLGSAAINAVNFSGSVSASQSYGESVSDSYSASLAQSYSDSKSTNYNYSYSS